MFNIRKGGAWAAPSYVFRRRQGATFVDVIVVRKRVAGGWVQVWPPSSGAAPQFHLNPSALTFVGPYNQAGSATPTTAVVIDVQGQINNIVWSKISGASENMAATPGGSPLGMTCYFTLYGGQAGTVYNTVWRCTIFANDNSYVSRDINVIFRNS